MMAANSQQVEMIETVQPATERVASREAPHSELTPYISVVAPVYNQRPETLSELARRLSASISTITQDFEIILIDDGSGKDVWETISRIAAGEPRVKGLKLSRNFGQHAAITAGLDYASGRWAVVMDADLQDRPEVIPELYAKAQEGYDVVFVDRIERPESTVYRFTAFCFYAMLNALSGERYNRLQGNFSIISRSVIDAFRLMRERTRFYGGTVRWVGFRQTSIAALHASPHAGGTSYNIRKRIRFACAILAGFSNRLLYLSIAVGLLMAIASFASAGFIIVDKLMNPGYPLPGWPSVMTAVFFAAGVTNVTIGLAGVYIGQIFEQTKERPLYIIASRTASSRDNVTVSKAPA